MIEALALLPLSVPGIALSVALIGAWSRVRGQAWLLLAGHGLYALPFMVSVVVGSLRGFDLENPARVVGGVERRRRLTRARPAGKRQERPNASRAGCEGRKGLRRRKKAMKTLLHRIFSFAAFAGGPSGHHGAGR